MSEETAQVKAKGKGRKKKIESKKTQESDPPVVTQVEAKKLQKSKKPQTPPKKKEEKKAGKGKQPLIKEDVDSLLEHFRSQNRPFTVNYLKDTLFLKLSTLQKNIDTLVSKGDIVVKEVGSTKIFLINQQFMPTINEQELDMLTGELDLKTEDYKQLLTQNQKLNEQLKALQKIPTLNELEGQLNDYKIKIEQVESKLLQYEDKDFKMASEQETQEIEINHQNMQNLCKKRKKIYNDAIGSILQESEITVQQFEKIIGISRD